MSSTQGKVSETKPSSPEPPQQALRLESPQQLSIKEESSEHETNFASQPPQAPTVFGISRPATPMLDAAPKASTSAPLPVAASPYNKPIFSAANGESPTWDELVTYAMAIGSYIMGMRYTLHFLNYPPDTWPFEISLTVASTIRATATIWRAVAIFGEYVGKWETHVANICLTTARAETTSARAASAQPTTTRLTCLKTPMPTKYDGKMGDPTSTFVVAYTNYRVMEPRSFNDNNQYICWVLQQMDGKVGLWSTRQLL